TMSNDHRQAVMDDQLRRIAQELGSRRAALQKSPPPWVEHSRSQDSPGYKDALINVLLWRAVADYDNQRHPVGQEPAPNISKTLRDYYDHAQQALNPTLNQDTSQTEFEELIAAQPDLVNQLHDDPVDFSMLDEVFDTQTHTTSLDAQTIATQQHQPGTADVEWSDFEFD